MIEVNKNEMLEAHVHMGHASKKWNPKAAAFILAKQSGFHVIDINKSIIYLQEALEEISKIIKEGKKILFVGTKKQAKLVLESECEKTKQPYLSKRWPGGILTNFSTVRKSMKKITSMDKYTKSSEYKNLTKKERLMIAREDEKLKQVLNGVKDMNRIPGAVFVIDVKKEHIAVMEARRMNLPVFGIVDTNSNPGDVDYPIPANDDSFKSIALIMKYVTEVIKDSLEQRNSQKPSELPIKSEAELQKLQHEDNNTGNK
jgi:small subunit ribosomal protein S2